MIKIRTNFNENKVYLNIDNNNKYKITISDWKLYSDPNKIISDKEEIIFHRSDVISNSFMVWFQPTVNMKNLHGIKIRIQDQSDKILIEEKTKIRTKHGKLIKEQIIVHHASGGLGDVLFLSPIIKKLSNIYGKKITIYTYFPELFINNPYVNSNNKINNSKHKQDIINSIDEEVYDIHHTGHFKPKPYGVINRINGDTTNQISHEIGIHIKENEKKLYFYPNKYEQIEELPEKYIVINPSITQEHRTYPLKKWNKLINILESDGYYVVAIGKDIIHKNDFLSPSHIRSSFKDKIIIKNGLNLINDDRQFSLSQAWHIINKSSGFISFQTGLECIAETTNAKLFILSSNFKFSDYHNIKKKHIIIKGECELYCSSSTDKLISEHGTLNTHIWNGCPLYDHYKCHPTPEEVSKSIIKNIDNKK